MKQSHKTLLLWVLLIMIFLGIWTLLSPDRPPATKASYTDFLALVEADPERGESHVEHVTIKDGDYIFMVKNPKTGKTEKKIAEGPIEVENSFVDELRKRAMTYPTIRLFKRSS